MGKILNLSGQKYGMLTVLSMCEERTASGKVKWNVVCDCGTHKAINGSHLVNGWVKSCGCTRADNVRKKCQTHGMAGTREHRIWVGMKQRCFNEKNPNYHQYGGRGITTGDRWKDSFENFYADLGPAPTELHTLERRDVDGIYEPNNCYWATRAEQANNTRGNALVEYKGKTHTMAELSKMPEVVENGISYQILYTRIVYYNYSVEQAVTTPVIEQMRHDITYEGKTLPLTEWARIKNINPNVLRNRISICNWPLEEALGDKERKIRKGREPKQIEFNGVSKSLKEWCTDLDLGYNVIRDRILKGMLFEVAIGLGSITKDANYTFNGLCKPLRDWCDKVGFIHAIRRLYLGWRFEEAIEPIEQKEITYSTSSEKKDEETHSLAWWCELLGLEDKEAIYLRILRGERFEDIVKNL